MRSEKQIKDIIISFANKDERVRVVLLNGSRANPAIKPDKYQDFDIVFIVDHFDSFTADHSWTNMFGEKLIEQLPHEMSFGNDDDSPSFSYLMLFTDGNRIDLTIFPAAHFKTNFTIDSLTIVWLDKDNLFAEIGPPTDKDYHVHQPTQKEFSDTCNEFWWVSTYVAKGLLRNEITYAKEMLETSVRPMFMKMIGWKIAIENNFPVSVGKGEKFIPHYLAAEDFAKILETYSDSNVDNNWKSLFIMTEMFTKMSDEVAGKLKLTLNRKEQENVTGYLKKLYGSAIN